MAERCVECGREVGPGTPAFSTRVRAGDGLVCAECAHHARLDPRADEDHVNDRLTAFGLGNEGGRAGGIG